MKIISWNVNGLRAVYKRNFMGWLEESGADIICLQEIKASPEQLAPDLVNHDGYHIYFNPAVKKGYSGVVVFTKEKPEKIFSDFHLEGGFTPTPSRWKKALGRFNDEGRFLRLDFKDFILINIYIPHGGRQKENLDYKLAVYDAFLKYLNKIKDKKVVLAGDLNIAHTELDLARPKGNKNNIMFTEAERSQIDNLISLGYVDTFREFDKEGGNYTWWPYAFESRERNIGWRIDYVFVSESLSEDLKGSSIYKSDIGSDHCPVGVEIKS